MTQSANVETLKRRQFEEMNFILNEDWLINHTGVVFDKESRWLLSLGSKFMISASRRNVRIVPLIANMQQWVQTIKNYTEKEIVKSKITGRISN